MVTICGTCSAGLVRVIVTPGTAAPDSSFTVPCMVEPPLCAETGAAVIPSRATRNTPERTVNRHHAPARVSHVINASRRTTYLDAPHRGALFGTRNVN